MAIENSKQPVAHANMIIEYSRRRSEVLDEVKVFAFKFKTGDLCFNVKAFGHGA